MLNYMIIYAISFQVFLLTILHDMSCLHSFPKYKRVCMID